MTRTFHLALVPIAVSAWLATTTVSAATLEEAREHLQRGRYAEAREAYEALLEEDATVEAIVGLSRLHQEQGRWDEAADVVDSAREELPEDERLMARRAELHRLRGDYEAAEKLALAAIEVDPDQPLARWVHAEVLMETGRVEEADVAYRWLVRYYNRVQPEDAESLMLVAAGALQYARWHSVSSIFNFVVNDLCPDALKDDESSWQAWLVSGTILLEKFNRAQAIPEFESGLAVNAHAADLHAMLGEAAVQRLEMEKALEKAEAALEINPAHPGALRLRADLHLADGDVTQAILSLEKARAVNPRDQRTLARLAACHLLADGAPTPSELEESFAVFGKDATGTIDPRTAFETMLADVAEYNRRPGYFLSELGQTLDDRRKYDLAETVYRKAAEVLPQIAEPKVGLGMLYMRVGRVDEAQPILDAAFESDPYHVRVSNTRKVLRVLGEYETIETEHFIVQFDGEKDRVLGERMAEYLEEIYPVYTGLYGFEPPEKTRFEIYNEHKGLSGHQWFSARMIGLPWIQTIGATTGMIVAFASPNSTGSPYNWAQVCRHEFVHVVTLQQTEFNIPHWFTEALAVTSEGYPRPSVWNELLLKRVPARDLRTLDDLTDGFVRPEDALDWQFAYCQSKLYADYMRDEFGDESIRRLLAAYEENETTTRAVPEVFGVPLAEFEAGYVEYLDRVVEEIRGPGGVVTRTPEEIERAYEDDPNDAGNAGRYAGLLYRRKESAEARKIAEAALESNPSQPDAAVVLAELELRGGDPEAAIETLEPALDESAPHPDVLETLAKLRVAESDTKEAVRLYELGRKSFPHDVKWVKGLAAAHLLAGDRPKLVETLTIVANTESDDADVRKRLAAMAIADEDFAKGEHWATRAMHVTAHDPEIHALRGRAFAGLGDERAARKSFETALQLDPENEDAKEGLAALES